MVPFRCTLRVQAFRFTLGGGGGVVTHVVRVRRLLVDAVESVLLLQRLLRLLRDGAAAVERLARCRHGLQRSTIAGAAAAAAAAAATAAAAGVSVVVAPVRGLRCRSRF